MSQVTSIEQLCQNIMTYFARKKIDLKYHELSPDGYFARLEAAGLTESVVSKRSNGRCERPRPIAATMRGRYIREFAGDAQPISVRWDRVILGAGKAAPD